VKLRDFAAAAHHPRRVIRTHPRRSDSAGASEFRKERYMAGYEAKEPSGWALAGVTFAATMLIVIGTFQALAGLVAIIDDNFYTVARNYTFDLDVSGWGWIHLIFGILLATVGFFLFAGRPWAVTTAIVLAALSAIANFFFIPYYPWWSILVIALDVWVIWALTRPGIMQQT
jgi:hypothetical protein